MNREAQSHSAATHLNPSPVHPISASGIISSCFGSSLVIPNEGSTARDHLGRDRTWMQWIRLSTLLVLVSLATCISFPFDFDDHDDETQKNNHHHRQHLNPFAVTFLVLSVLLPLLGFFEYLSTHHAMSMKRGFVQTGFFSGFMIMATCLVLSLFTFVLFFDGFLSR
ncbi:hypothetical protein PGT21_008507 [Puccinia graminis f. sp. tritici]|uniref:DUF202 domain-containing protein n=1 Tax=Puccinia graminis f. sp. tritici TaxID=56615 RepID=A0A5B0LT39_PUCGR|nr:hypothetical protein PGT21_008507 [Puccinia graminis f. sp. tritici]KAA1092218.1 hypothetical protein PGTUg99_022533 [Puccinia graminis f. sp. tritici]